MMIMPHKNSKPLLVFQCRLSFRHTEIRPKLSLVILITKEERSFAVAVP